jgi:bacillopeptidase F (M6 metalloprotease family)
MGGLGTAHTESLYQNVSIPASAQRATLSLWLNVATDETTTTNAYDKFSVQIKDQNGAVVKTLAIYSNLDQTTGYVQKTFDVSAYRGQNVQVFFRMVEDNGKATSFRLDDITLTIQ